MEYNILVGTLHDAINESTSDKFLHIKDAKILNIGNIGDHNTNLETFDYSKNELCPGFVDAHSHIGLYYESFAYELKDGNESSRPLTPELRTLDAFWPYDTAIDDVVAGGVTTVCVLPGSANLIGGVGAVLKLKSADIVDKMVINPEAAMKIALGGNPKNTHGKKERSPITRMASAALIRQAFLDAREYIQKRLEEKPPGVDLGKENLSRILRKEMPVFAHCARTDDIATLLRLQNEFEFDLVLHHAYEAHISEEIMQTIVDRNIQVVLGPNFRIKGSSESQLFSFESTKILMDKGVSNVSHMTDHPVIPGQYLPMQAALCVRAGLDNLRALQTITINPANILNIGDRVGSIDVGKDADLVIWDGHPLDSRSKPLRTIVNGKTVFKENE